MNQKLPSSRWRVELSEALARPFFRNFLERLAKATLGILLLAPVTVGQCQAAAFQDLGFESPVFVPVSSQFQGSVDPASALPVDESAVGLSPARVVSAQLLRNAISAE